MAPMQINPDNSFLLPAVTQPASQQLATPGFTTFGTPRSTMNAVIDANPFSVSSFFGDPQFQGTTLTESGSVFLNTAFQAQPSIGNAPHSVGDLVLQLLTSGLQLFMSVMTGQTTPQVGATNSVQQAAGSAGFTPTNVTNAALPADVASPDLASRQNFLNAYLNSANPNNPGLDSNALQQISGNQGLSALALSYGAEVKAAADEVLNNPGTSFTNTINRSNNPEALLNYMQFDMNNPADQFLATMMVYKNGAYNGGTVGQYRNANIVAAWEQYMGPLDPAARRAAIIDERRAMGLMHAMMQTGVIDPNQEVLPDGSSRHGFWDPAFNTAYLNAREAVTSGTLANDLALERQGQGHLTTGRVDAFNGAPQIQHTPDAVLLGLI